MRDPGDATESSTPVETDTAVVTRVVDGDTVELESGETVRVTGIDTPERDERCYEQASERMAALVEGETVTLTRDGENRGYYDRLLRYIDVPDTGGTDAGLTLIEERLADAAYDSQDGYPQHAREQEYRDADDDSGTIECGAG